MSHGELCRLVSSTPGTTSSIVHIMNEDRPRRDLTLVGTERGNKECCKRLGNVGVGFGELVTLRSPFVPLYHVMAIGVKLGGAPLNLQPRWSETTLGIATRSRPPER